MSVVIISYEKKKNSKGGSFLVLTVEGGINMRKTHDGKWMANSLKANIVANIDEQSIKSMIGKSLPGTVIKQDCSPYIYRLPSGEQKTLTYRYEYVNNEEEAEIQELSLAGIEDLELELESQLS